MGTGAPQLWSAILFYFFPGGAFAPPDPPFPVGLRPLSFNDFTEMTRSENPGVLFSEVFEAPQARCSGEQSYFSDMTCSEHLEPVFSDVFEAPQARCSVAKCLIIH